MLAFLFKAFYSAWNWSLYKIWKCEPNQE